MSGPPPWTRMGRRPTHARRTRSVTTEAFSSGEVMAAPPYLTTMVLPRNFWMKGRDSERISNL